jgi:hypothetical protein
VTGELWIDLITKLAWPVVALVGVLILGPGGLLKNIVMIISESLFGLNKAVGEFREITLAMKNELDRFTELSQSLSQEFSSKVESIRLQISSTGGQLDGMSSKLETMRESSSALLQEFVAREVAGLQLPDTTPITEVDPRSAHLGPDALYDSLRASWDMLVGKLRLALENYDAFDARQIGTMAYLLVDGRRRVQISTKEASQISDLHSQFKSFARLYSTRDQWLTPELHDEFTSAVRAATASIHV